MKYLITSPPIIDADGTYHLYEITREHALRWFEVNHREQDFKLAIVPNVAANQLNANSVELMAKEVDRYISTSSITQLPAITHEDEVLLVRGRPQQQRPGQPARPLTIDDLYFSMFKRLAERHGRDGAEHEHHEHGERREQAVVQ